MALLLIVPMIPVLQRALHALKLLLHSALLWEADINSIFRVMGG